MAIEVGRAETGAEQNRFPDGVWLVDFVGIQDGRLVPQAVADVLKVNFRVGLSLQSTLLDFLSPRSFLLIFDNCEHVISEVAQLASSILAHAPRVQVLATSQVPINIEGETEWLVPSLSLPADGEEPADIDDWLSFSAIHLFVERAKSARADFRLTSQNASAVLEICRRLDGIPLAIELAAVRVKLLTVHEIAERLDDRLALLTHAKRGVHSRHQTLSAALEWSYSLLSKEEQGLLNRLGIFAGSWTLEAAQSVCGDDILQSSKVFDLLSSLVDRSLIVSSPTGSETRYRLLESVRLFALSQLSDDEKAAFNDRLLNWMDQYISEKSSQVHGPRQVEICRAIKSEMPNLRAAIHWAMTASPPDSRLLHGLRVAAGASWAMRIIGHLVTSCSWLEPLINASEGMETEEWINARAAAQLSLARQYWALSAFHLGSEQARASLQLYERLGESGRVGMVNAQHLLFMCNSSGDLAENIRTLLNLVEGYQAVRDRRGTIEALVQLGLNLRLSGRVNDAEDHLKQALQMAREVKNAQFIGLACREYARLLRDLDRWAEAFALLEEAHQNFDALGFIHGLNFSQYDLAEIAFARGMLDRADSDYRKSLLYADLSGMKWLKQYAIYRLGLIALYQGRDQEAEEHFRQVIFNFITMEEPNVVAHALRGIAAIYAPSNPQLAARLEGHAAALDTGTDEEGFADAAMVMPQIAAARTKLSEAKFDEYARQGARMSIQEILEGNLPTPQKPLPAASNSQPVSLRKAEKMRFAGLTAREREVAVFIAQGLSNPAIAVRMVLSERTVTTHITHILEKLGYSSRTQIAAWAVEIGLVKTLV